MKDLSELMNMLGYQFNDPSFLETALTHRSVGAKKNNERLEFLGDASLNMIIAEVMYQRFNFSKEGELSRLRAHLVKEETLAQIAREFHLSDYLHLGSGETKSGGANRDSILADAVEAIIGAIYLDSDFTTCQRIVLNWYAERLDNLASTEVIDPKTLLQEFLQSKKMTLPSYNVIKIEGAAHEQMFYVECKVKHLKIVAQGCGKSKRRAEQEAAKEFLILLQQHE